ncbi:MAG: 30S ribosomal protein S2 [Malacoplasma sp.]|nr:30S ribosomal protein S2 [Malacoplasma sp.]MDE7075405.1 30S ribosomal protein S2 [Malacoplasma sp.]
MPKKAEAKTESSKKTDKVKKETVEKDVKADNKETKKTADKEVSKTVTKKTANSVDKKTNDSGSKFESNTYKEKVAEIENSILQKIKENPTITGKPFRKLVSVNKLMETGAHIGLTSRKWNPKMKKYIYTKKGSNHIIDLLHTVISLNVAYNYLLDLVKANSNLENSPILIVGTRGKTIKNHVKDQAKRVHAYYINERWLGGTLTNFSTITKSVAKFNNLILIHKNGEINKYTKKEQVELKKKTEKYAKYFSGIRTMKDLPKAIILTDPETNKIAIREAKKLGIKVIAICNTNANPDLVDFVIPANNYSIKSVYLLIGLFCDAIAEAKGLPKMFAEKKDEEIILPEVIKRKPDNRRFNNYSSQKQ